MKKSGIYKIVSPTGRVYIGQSLDIDKRWKSYLQMDVKTKRQTRLWRSFLKHGVENHSFTIVELCTIDQLNTRERYWQETYNVIATGLNCLLQDTCEKKRVVSDETRAKISRAGMGKPVSDSYKERLRVQMTGNTYHLGRVRPQHEKDKISQTMRLISLGENNNMYGRRGENSPFIKIILNLETGIFYYGVKEAAESNNIPYNSLKKQICGNRKNTTALRYV